MIEKIVHCNLLNYPTLTHFFRCTRLHGHPGECVGVRERIIPTPHRHGGWIQTYTGKQFWPMDPRIGDFDINDIAHALSNICRFAGHTREFYSVAQHSVLVSLYCRPEFALEGLLHDGTEAYLTDIPRPLKHDPSMHGYRQLETDMEYVLARQFNLAYPWPETVKLYDNLVLVTERRDILRPSQVRWTSDLEALQPLDFTVVPWAPREAKQRFLDRYHELTQEREQGLAPGRTTEGETCTKK